MALLEKDIWEIPIIIRHHERLDETKKYIAEENLSGVFAEFGVNTGSSINYFASLYSRKVKMLFRTDHQQMFYEVIV